MSKEGRELIKSEIKLTIGILVSNHVQYIRNVMEGLKPLLEAVPSELIVVDTKGEETDGSIDIVREYTDKIYPFTWCDDFAKARNVCMEHARGEWFLYQDDDEWFDDVTEFIEFFRNGDCDKYNSGYYYTRDYDLDGTYSTGVAGRMIRRRKNTCFEGRVHETFNEVFTPNKQFECFTHHYGYAFPNLEAAKKHQERNVSILKKELVEVGCTPRLCAQMTQELMYLDHSAEAGYHFAVDAINRLERLGQLEDSCSQWVMAATVRHFSKKKDLEGAKAQLKKIETNYKLAEITQLVLAGTMANLAALTWAEEDMYHYASKYVSMWDWRQNHKEEAVRQTQLDFPKFFDESYYYRMIHIGAVAANRMGRFGDAQRLWERMPWNSKDFDAEPYKKDKEETIEGLKKTGGGESVVGNARVVNALVNAIKANNKKKPALYKSDIKLTIGMLVSNNKQYIRKVMEGLKPLLDAVPSELIVVDTKGAESDGSIDIVREYTDKIYPFTWCNDFSAARNVCLQHARGEWFMYQDDDEWFDDVQEFIDFFNSGECEEYYSGIYYTRDYLPNGSYSMGIAGRMVRRTDQTHFVGRIHETFNEVFAPNKQFNCFTHHYGYAYENEEARAAKQKRNMDILEEEIRDKGLTPQRAAQMVQELLGRTETLEEGYKKAEEYIPQLEKMGEMKNSCSQWVLTASVRSFAGSDRFPELYAQARKIQENYYLSETAQLVLAATVANDAARDNNCEVIMEYLDLYLAMWDWRLANPEEALLQTQLDFPRFYTDAYYEHMIHLAAVTANYQKNYDLANKYWKRMPWQREGLDTGYYQQDLNTTIQGMQKQREEEYEEQLGRLRPLLEIIAEATVQMRNEVAAGNVAVAKEYLTAMQEAAIALGTNLDTLVGEGTTTVTLLEQYCELVWNCSTAETINSQLEIADILCEAVPLIAESFHKDTRKQKTILLFPTKPQNWYRFEPYYTEAKQNGDVVKVIPVPYFDKFPDGRLGEQHFEKEGYPEELPLTDYDKYHYPGALADLAVVEAEYQGSHVFQGVHPFYLESNLRKYAKEVEVLEQPKSAMEMLKESMEQLERLLEE